MTSIINNQPVYIQQLATPQVTDTLTSPSLPPNIGCLAFDATDPSSIYIGNGTVWNKITSSGSTGGNINGETLTNCNIDSVNNTVKVNGTNINSLINQDVRSSAEPSFIGLLIGTGPVPLSVFTRIQSNATIGRFTFLPDSDGTFLLDSASQIVTNKTIANTNNNITVGGTAIGSLINQDVRTTASPTHALLTVTSGVQFPNSGGTPATLDRYDPYNANGEYFGVGSFFAGTGIIAITRIGRVVTVSCTSDAFGTTDPNDYLTVDSLTVPPRFLPQTTLYFPVRVRQTGVDQLGLLTVNTNASNPTIFEVRATVAGGLFSAGANSGVYQWTVSYTV